MYEEDGFESNHNTEALCRENTTFATVIHFNIKQNAICTCVLGTCFGEASHSKYQDNFNA